MKLLLVTSTFPFGKGEEFLEEELVWLVRSGIKVSVLPIWPRGNLRKSSVLNSIEIIRLNRFLLNYFKFIRNFVRNFRDSRTQFVGKRILVRTIRESYVASLSLRTGKKDFGWDHIHSYWISGCASVAMEFSENTKIPWSSTVHSGDFIEAASIARKFNSAKGVRFISNYLINKAKMQYELPTNTPVIHLGVTTKDLSPNSHNLKSKQYIVCVANLIPIKNHRLIIKVAEELKKMGFDFQIDLIGDGPERLSLQELVVELGLQNYINLVGYLPHDELIDLLKSGKYVLSILSSTITSNLQQEGIPVAILESLACGIPVLASNTGGIPEIFGYSEYFLFEDNSEKALEEKIVNILTLSNEDYEELRVRSKAIVDSKFNSEINGNLYAAWLKSLRDTN